jgi:hypothetical protein
MTTRRVAVGAIVTMLAAWLVGTGTASAAKKTMVLQTPAGTLEAGAELTLSSSNFQFENSGGLRLSCTTATLTGTLTSNDAPAATASFTAGEFVSTPHVGCFTGLESEPFFEYTPIQALRLPWTATFKTNLTATLAGAEGVGFGLEATPPGCAYLGSRIVGALDAPLGFMETAGPAQKLRLATKSHCWAKGPVNANKGTIGAEWALTSEGEEVRAHVVR